MVVHIIPTPDSGILNRLYANLFGSGGGFMLDVPDKILKRLYTYGSLDSTGRGVEFEVKNRLSDAKVSGVSKLIINGQTIDHDQVLLETADGKTFTLEEVSEDNPIPFSVGRTVMVIVEGMDITAGEHEIYIEFTAKPFGDLSLEITDKIREEGELPSIPRDEEDNYSEEAIAKRQEYLDEKLSKIREAILVAVSVDRNLR